MPRSHVIPRWMYEMLPMDVRKMRIASSHPGDWEQRSQTGIYDSFVCQCCEDRFARLDDYAAIVLRRQPVSTARGWDFGEYDYSRLKWFYLSILWRAHVCQHQFFDTVDIKPYDQPLAYGLLDKGADVLDDFEVILSTSSHSLAFGVLTPAQVLIVSVTYWQLYLPIFQALIKIDSVPGAACLRPYAMKQGTNLCMIEKKFTEFGEERIAGSVIRANLEKKNANRG